MKNIKLQNLRRDFENMKMKDNEIVDNFMTQIMNIVNQLRKYGEDLSDQRVIEILLRCLPKKFEAVVIPIEEFKDLSQMHIHDLNGSLISHESRMNGYVDNPLENGFKYQLHVTRGRRRAGNRGRGGRSDDHSDNRNDLESEENLQHNTPSIRGSNSRTWQPINQRYDRSKVECFYCKKFGHFANKCWKK